MAAGPTTSPAEAPRPRKRRWWRAWLWGFTLGLWSIVPLTRWLWRAGHRKAAVAVGGGTAIVLLLLIIGIAAGGNSTKTPASSASSANAGSTAASDASAKPTAPATPQIPRDELHARIWIRDHFLDADRVQANIEDTQAVLGITIKSPTLANVNQLAQQAQQAHDNLDAIRTDFASGSSDSGTLGDAELSAFSGANDLKNAMGALVAYTGNPNPATLAHFTSQYQGAVAEWNSGIRTIWRVAHRRQPPTV